MPSQTRKKDHDARQFDVSDVSRIPQQGRSKASFERMMSAARDLMLERGNEDFTLQDVSARGSVSIGSIYLRFESKENLVRAVIGNALQEIFDDEQAMLASLQTRCQSLDAFVPAFVHDYSEVLHRHAQLLRISMQRASVDDTVAGPGRRQADTAAARCTAAILAHRSEFGGVDHELKASSTYHIIFTALARELSLGSSGEPARNYDWNLLKQELVRMCLSYLRAA